MRQYFAILIATLVITACDPTNHDNPDSTTTCKFVVDGEAAFEYDHIINRTRYDVPVLVQDSWQRATPLRVPTAGGQDNVRIAVITGNGATVATIEPTRFLVRPASVFLFGGHGADPAWHFQLETQWIDVGPPVFPYRAVAYVVGSDECPRLEVQDSALYPTNGWAAFAVFYNPNGEIKSVSPSFVTIQD